jgi:ABC-2 family transporter protein
MQKILAIAWLTWKAAVRFRLFLVIAALLVLAVVGLPLVIKDDGTAQGFTQIILTYTLSVTTGLLGLSTLWLACGTLARDIEECQIQVVATKPIARWQIWIGKWLGIISLNAVLLAISGGCVYGLLQWRATKLPAEEQAKLRAEVMVARGSAREPSQNAKIDAEARQLLAERLKQNPGVANLSDADKVEVIKQITEQVRAAYQLVPPAYVKQWKIDLGLARNFLHDKPLQLRVKFNTANGGGSTVVGLWQVGDPASKNYWRSDPMSLAPNTFHEFEIPPNLFDQDGILTIAFLNPNQTALLFPLDEGMEVLYPESSFAGNFARGLGIIFCWMALLAALGLAAASFLSFPVAAFFSLAMLALVFSSGTLAEAVDVGTVGVGNEEKGIAGHSAMDVIVIPFFKVLLTVVNLTRTVSPIDSLSTGRVISWGQLAASFGQVVVLLGGFFSAAGILLFYRRELATAQGTQ